MTILPWTADADIGRRETLALAGLMASAIGFGTVAAVPARAGTRDDLTLWYDRPAAAWTQALPIGNGRLGAMVFGRVGQERLQLNEATLWAGSPYTPDNPAARDALPKVRRLIAAGRFREATELADRTMMAKPLHQMPYGSLGDLLLTFPAAVRPQDYRRALDLAEAVATTSYRAPGRTIHTEAFASGPDQVVVFDIRAAAGTIDLDLSWRPPRQVDYGAVSLEGSAAAVAHDTEQSREAAWLVSEPVGPHPPGTTVAADGAAALLVTGRNIASETVPARLTYAMRVRVVSDGTIVAGGDGMHIRSATSVTLLIAAATSHRGPRDVGGDPVSIVRAASEAAAARPYALLRQDHVVDHRALFGRMAIDLGRTAAADRPTDRRIAATEGGDDPALAALYAQYGRYLLIASSRPGGQPANLQGIWNEGVNPPWGSKYTININTEMNYWPADPAGLGECVEPLLRMTEELADSGARTARTMYGARGWVAHHNTDLWRAAAPIDGARYGLWPCGGAWLCTTLWTHWDYYRDPRLLARLYPLLKGASLFFLDTLVVDPGGRGFITSPSLSPENEHPFGSSLCAGPAMDRQIIRDLFAATIEAAGILKRDEALIAMIGQASARLAPDRVGAAGQLQEWLEDWDGQAPSQDHRHVSHLYAVYPSSQINVRDTPDLIAAAKVSLDRRGDLSTGWATAWRACLWARMGDGERAYGILKGLLGPKRTYPNMFDAHPPFQIDGNFGGTAAILEMLLQSWGGEVHLLPALPAAWPDGSVHGVHARGRLRIDLEWKAGKPKQIAVSGAPGSVVQLRYRRERSALILGSTGTALRRWN